METLVNNISFPSWWFRSAHFYYRSFVGYIYDCDDIYHNIAYSKGGVTPVCTIDLS